MKALLIALILTCSISAQAAVVRRAPDFTFVGAGKKSLRSLNGQPVVLLIADSSKNKKLKKQLKRMRAIYQEFASRGVVIAAAVQQDDGEIPSDIPVVIVNNGPGVAAAYGLTDGFKLTVIGKDGNLDLETDRVVAGTRVREVIQNSFEVQKTMRRETPKRRD